MASNRKTPLGREAKQGVLRGHTLRLDQQNLADFPIFSDLAASDLDKLVELATVRRMEPGTICFQEGDEADRVYMMVDGVMRIVRSTQDGEQVVILHIVPGQPFGIAKVFDTETYQATAEAASQGYALCWSAETWEKIVAEYPGFLSSVRRAVSKRIGAMQDKIVALATGRVEQRVARALLKLVEQAGTKTKEGYEISFPITRQDISEMTGTNLHSVSRFMSAWQKDGIVKSSRRRVVVCRPADLPI